jgi:hypothetical protein
MNKILTVFKKSTWVSQVWRHIPVTPTLGKMRQKDHEFEANLDNSRIKKARGGREGEAEDKGGRQ